MYVGEWNFCCGNAVVSVLLVQGQIRHDAFKALVFSLKLLQPFELIPTHATIFFAPPIIGLTGYPDLPHSLGN